MWENEPIQGTWYGLVPGTISTYAHMEQTVDGRIRILDGPYANTYVDNSGR